MGNYRPSLELPPQIGPRGSWKWKKKKEKQGYSSRENSFVEAYKTRVIDFTLPRLPFDFGREFPTASRATAEIRSGVEGWINKSAVPTIDAKRAGKDTECSR